MHYGNELYRTVTEEGRPHLIKTWVQNLSEHTGEGNSNVLTFPSQAEAEVYAQNHELKNYSVRVYGSLDG